MSVTNKNVIITGAAGGIGRAAALAFAKNGFGVLINYRTAKDAAEKLCEEINSQGGRAVRFKADVSVRGDVDEMTDFARRELGAIGVLVNNAGIDFDRMMGVTVKGAFNCTQAALPDMVHDKSGKIINVSSMWGVSGASCEVHYSAAKSALIGLTKALARELAPSNIQVNCIAPGVIDTDMNASLGSETLELLKEESPMGRFGTPEEVARLMLFLAGDGSDFITGQTIGIDGAFI